MAAGVRVKSYHKQLTEKIRREMVHRLQFACEVVRGQVVSDISVSTRESGPSAPGEPPHADTGKLRQSIFSHVDTNTLEGMVGTPLRYGLYLEKGTGIMSPRPYLVAGLQKQLAAVRRILTAPIK